MKIQELISDFRQKQHELSRQANRAFRGEFKKLKNPPAINVPDLISDLLLPVINVLTEAMPEMNLVSYTKKDISLQGGYYTILNKDKVVIGRLSCKLGNAVRLFYAQAKGSTFGLDKEFSSLSELVDIIKQS